MTSFLRDVANQARAGFNSELGADSGKRSGGGAGGAGGRRHGQLSRRGRVFLTVFAVLVVLVVVVLVGAYLGTEVMWYAQLGYGPVIWTTLMSKIILWIVYAAAMGAVTYLAATLAIASRPAAEDGTTIRTDGSVIELKTSFSSRRARRVAVVVAVILGVFFGADLIQHWNQILLLFHSQSFGRSDPQFGLDISFYVFILPALLAILGSVLTLLVVGLVVCLIAQLILSGISFHLPHGRRGILDMTRRARRQVALWLLLVMLVWAARIGLGAFTALVSQDDRITGAAYTAVHAGIPMTFAVAGLIALLGVVLAFWLMTSRGFSSISSGERVGLQQALKAWRLPATAVAVVLVVSLLGLVAYPALLQQFRVNPNAQELESQYIARNIKATSDAFRLGDVKVQTYRASTKGAAGDLSQDAETTAQIRLLDPQVVAPTFRQLQQSKQYYDFTDTLAVDKYDIKGESYDTVIGARELNLAGNDNHNWVNDHTVYTHGYGVVAAYGNKVSQDGQPLFFEKSIPTQGALTDSEHYQPRIYFSPNAPEYSIVGAPSGTKSWEFDYPTGSAGATNTFTGNGGPGVGNLFTRLLYAIRFGSTQILLSDRVTADSQILYDRSPVQRVAKVAPYLELDSRVYPAVVDGRVKWIVDAYTTSDMYPYSQSVDLGTATTDSLTSRSKSLRSLATGRANYMRNSVKATVDAYDGSVDLYAWNPRDPVLKAWEAVFPGQYKPISAISGDLMSHMRYPESLFKVQRELLAQYHVTSANQFFSGEDFWQTPVDPTLKANDEDRSASSNSGSGGGSGSGSSDDLLQPPYYLTMKVPGQSEPLFSLSTSYIPAGALTREILTGFLSVDSDAGHTKGVIGQGYGTLRLLELPKNSTVPGPGQAQNNFNADADVSKELNLLESGSTSVTRGNLLTLPIGGGLVYVQPVYVQSSGSTSFPLLKKVLVAFGEQVGFADTLDQALDQVFGGNSGASAGDADNAKKPGGTGSTGSGSSGGSGSKDSDQGQGSGQQPGGGSTAAGSAALKQALADADQAIKDSDAALKDGDFAKYGQAQAALKDAIKRAVEAEQ